MHEIITRTDPASGIRTAQCRCGWKSMASVYANENPSEYLIAAIYHLEDVIKENERLSRDYDDYY